MTPLSEAPDPSSRREVGPPVRVISLLLALYFLTRLGSLSVLPIFLDEAVHIQWAERLYHEGRILRPMGSGRLLAVGAYGLALPFEDRLFAARLVATLAGAAALGFTLLLSHRLFGKRASVIAGCLYILSPFALVYDRLALSDGFLSASITGLMFVTWALVQTPRRRNARRLMSALIALAVLSKVSALLFVLTVPLGVLALAKDRRKAVQAAALSCAIGLVCVSPLLWFFASNGGEVAAQHVVDPRLTGTVLLSTFADMRGWLLSYFTPPALLFAAVSLILLRDGRALWLGGSVALPFLLFALFSQPWSARYVLPTLPPFLLLISGGIEVLAARFKPFAGAWAALGLAVLVSLPGVFFDLHLLSEPASAPFPKDDRIQLVTGWPAGYGVRELSLRLKREAATGPITAFLDMGGTRTVPTSLPILLARHPAVRLVEGDFGSVDFRSSMIQEMRTSQVFAILGPRPLDLDFQSLVQGAMVERVEVFQRPEGEWVATLFRLRPLVELGSSR